MGKFHPKEAIILCGGKGRRLKAVLQDIPKPLAEISGKPFLEYIFMQLKSWNVQHTIISIGFLGDHIKSYYKHHVHNIDISYVSEATPLGTGGAMGLSASALKGDEVSKPIIVMNGDSYCEIDFPAVVLSHTQSCFPVTLVLTEVLDVARYGAVEIDANGKIKNFEEKGNRSGPGLINAGIYFMNLSLLRSIPKENYLSFEHEVLPSWIEGGINGFVSRGSFIDIGTPESLIMAQAVFKNHDIT